MSVRLFVALDLPRAAKDALAAVSGLLRERLPDARWVPRDNLHATLSFLGSVPEERVEEVSRALSTAVAGLVQGPSRLAGLGAFPSRRRARVVWAGLADEAGAIEATARTVIEAMATVGFEPEARPFHAHVTLARLRAPAAVTFPADVVVPPIEIPVDRVTLFRSHLGRPAPRYEALAVFPFRRR